jgi:hypothetical protein
MVGVIGALQADLALAMIAQKNDIGGTLVTYDAERDVLRRTRVSAREGCALCERRIDDLDERRYLA